MTNPMNSNDHRSAVRIADRPSCSLPKQPAIVARQPIVNSRGELYGYELLYRAADDAPRCRDGTVLTSTVLVNVFSELGLDRVVGVHRAFVNLPREFVTGKLQLPHKPDQVVVEILEDIEIDDEVLTGIQRLKQDGYLIALDDVVFSPELEPLLELSDIVKVELPAVPAGELPRHVDAFRQWPLKLLAEKVETQEQMTECVALGFDYFQGYHLARPTTLRRTKLGVSRHVVLKLLAQLCTRTCEIQELATTVKGDPALCARLLRYINSAQYAVRNISSVEHAIALIGNQGMRALMTMVQLSGLSDQPPELITEALLRGLMCHNLSSRCSESIREQCYLVGILSAMDAILDEPMEEILKDISIDSSLRRALLVREGEMGELLNAVLAYQRGNWELVRFREIPLHAFRDAYLTAVADADLMSTCVALQSCSPGST